MFCKHCGKEIPEESKFCRYCGKNLEKESQEAEDTPLEEAEVGEESKSVEGTIPKEANEVQKDKTRKSKKKYILIAGLFLGVLAGLFAFNLNRANASIGKFESQVEDYEKTFANYVIDEEKEEYASLLEDCSKAIENREADKIDELIKNLEKLKGKLSSKNQKEIEGSLERLKNSDTSRGTNEELERIESLMDQVEKELESEKYLLANKSLDELENLINLLAIELDNLNMSVEQVDTSEYPRVKLYLSIEDEFGNVAKNLDQKFFYLSEKLSQDSEYIKKEIQKVVQLDQKENLNINIVADVSGSMYGQPLENAKAIMTNFLNQVQFEIGDKVALTAFSDGVYNISDFTSDKNRLVDEIYYLETGNMTSLYDALFTSVNKTAIENGAKCVIAFTDGLDNNSYNTPESVLAVAHRYNIPIFIIGVGDDLNSNVLTYIAEGTNGFYTEVSSFANVEEIYNRIYKENKELYVLEYETIGGENTSQSRDLVIDFQNRELGGNSYYTYEPHLLMSESNDFTSISDIDKLISDYLKGYVQAINNTDFSYIDEYVVTDGPLYKEVYEYIQKDIKERFLSVEILEKTFTDNETCIVKFHDTYEVQNYKKPLHLRTLESEYVVKKQANGEWKIYAFNKLIKVINKINS